MLSHTKSTNHILAPFFMPMAFIVKIFLSTGFLALSAQIMIPLPFVPITGQTLGLIIISLTMGRCTAVSTVILYLLEGALNFPVFSGGQFGILHLLGPSGGYLWGFIPAAHIMGHFSEKGYLKSYLYSTFTVISGIIVIYSFGLAQLALFVPAEQVLSLGLFPFIPSEIIKCTVTIILVKKIYPILSHK